MSFSVLINPGGGSAGGDAIARVKAALARHGLDGTIEQVPGPELADRAAALAKAGAEIVVAAGGDGTQSAVAGALAGTATAHGVLPLGTLNHLARDLGISLDLDEAVATLAAGHRRKIDLASLNGRYFVNNSAIGLYPLMVVGREAMQRANKSKIWGSSKKWVMLVSSIRTLVRFRHHRLRLLVNDSEVETLVTPLLFVGNNDYQLTLPAAGKRDKLDAGRLCVVVMRRTGRLGLVAASLRLLAGRSRDDDMVHLDDVQRLKVSSHRSQLTVSSDGETLCLAPPLDYRIHPQALTVIAPA